MNRTTSAKTRPPKPSTPNAFKTLSRVGLVLFTAACGWVCFLTLANPPLATTLQGWPEMILLLTGALTILLSLGAQLPAQNVILAATLIAVIGGGIHAVGALTNLPFGPFIYTSAAGPAFFETLPWWIPLIWITFILSSRAMARLILRPWRRLRAYGFWLIGVTLILTLLLDLAFEPFASKLHHYWIWSPTKLPLLWCLTPMSNFLGFTTTTLLILMVTTPSLINKSQNRFGPQYAPALVWLLLNALMISSAVQNKFWPAVVLVGAGIVVTSMLAVRGARW